MAGKKCKLCGFENDEDAAVCIMCGQPLSEEAGSEPAETASADRKTESAEIYQTAEQNSQPVDDGMEYYVFCPESRTTTILPNRNVREFYCKGCNETHPIDGMIWQIESREKEGKAEPAADQPEHRNGRPGNFDNKTQNMPQTAGDKLVLEEVHSHYRIEIDQAGGTLGRYGKYGSEYFQRNNLLTVSGEHCLITYEYGNWVIRHKSRTNQTKYNDMILERDEPMRLEDGKMLTLANTVSFVIHIH